MTGPHTLAAFRKRFAAKSLMLQGARWQVIDTQRGANRRRQPTLVLLPGTLGTGEIFWRQISALSKQMRVLALTYPAVPDVNRLADAPICLLDRLGIQRASVLGTSLGGFVAQTLALRHPERVETLFVANSLCDPQAAWRAGRPSQEQISLEPAHQVHARRLANLENMPVADEGIAQAKAVILDQARTQISARHLKARILTLLKADKLPKLNLPDERIVVIDCDDDPVIALPGRKEVRARYPQAEQHTFPTGGHFPYLSRPEQYTEILQARLG